MYHSQHQDRDNYSADIRTFFKRTGFLYGSIFALTLILAILVPDALSLARYQAELPWAKLALGIPLAILLCGFAGRLATPPSPAILSIAIWIFASGLTGLVIGLLPFQGLDFVAWLLNPDLWGRSIFPASIAALTRAGLITLVSAGVGLPLGILERIVTEISWEQSGTNRKAGWGSLIALAISIPFAFLPTSVANEQVYSYTQIPYRAAARTIQQSQSNGIQDEDSSALSRKFLEEYADSFTATFTTHLVQYQLTPPQTGLVDIHFQNDLTLRCTVINAKVIFCEDHSSQIKEWMGNLIQFGISGQREPLQSLEQNGEIDLNSDLILWLQSYGDEMSASYEMKHQNQIGGFAYFHTLFDNGFEMTCLLSGNRPVVIERCTGKW
ncbi:MAG: hypothetical protein R6U57_01730 [Anaerolineales bacterium]